MTRYFCIYDPITKEKRGRYSGATPKQAASKASTKLLRGKADGEVVRFCIQETTRNIPHIIFAYEGRKIKLDNPLELDIGEETVKYMYRNKIKRIDLDSLTNPKPAPVPDPVEVLTVEVDKLSLDTNQALNIEI